MIDQWGPVVFLSLLVAGSFWLIAQLNDEGSVTRDERRHVADVYVTDFETVVMGPNGKPLRELHAELLSHFTGTDTKELTKPYMVLHNENRTPWHVRSERGWVSANDDVMLLLGEVHIWRDTKVGVRELDLRTTDLRVLPESEYGETDKPVVIRTPTSESRGTGMRAYLSQRRIELLSEVRTIYEK